MTPPDQSSFGEQRTGGEEIDDQTREQRPQKSGNRDGHAAGFQPEQGSRRRPKRRPAGDAEGKGVSEGLRNIPEGESA